MLRLNRMTDYAILVLGALSARPSQVVPGAVLAQDTQLNQPTVAKIAKALVKAEIISAERGVNGGYYLRDEANKITVARVIEAIEGPIALTACVDGVEDPCETRHGCFMSGHWNQVNQSIREALEKVSLVELFDPEAMFPPAVSEKAPQTVAIEDEAQALSGQNK
jgi:FeS assembly SUF system regulator